VAAMEAKTISAIIRRRTKQGPDQLAEAHFSFCYRALGGMRGAKCAGTIFPVRQTLPRCPACPARKKRRKSSI